MKTLSSLIGTMCAFALIHQAGAAERNYKPEHLEAGQQLFTTHCAVCHGDNAEGRVKNWQEPGADGKLPPPPLNGTAHTWHHSTSALHQTIMQGTLKIGGSMPPFAGKLGEAESLQIIYWLTSLWPDELFEAWKKQH